MMRTTLSILATIVAIDAASCLAQEVPSEPVFEVLGLERWTVDMVADSVASIAPDVSLREAACAVILRDSVGFAQAAVETFRFPEGEWTTLTVVEPQHAERVSVRINPDSMALRDEWASIRRILEDHYDALGPLQDYAFLSARSDSFFGQPVAPAAIELRDEVRRVALAHGDSLALWTLDNDRNRQNRAVAALILGHFPERETTWHALMRALRGPSDWPSQIAESTLAALSRDAQRPVDWRPIEEDLVYLMGGTNLFAYLDVLGVLARTHVSLELGRRLVAVDSPLLLHNLQSLNPSRGAVVRRFLTRALGIDHGDDTTRWVESLRSYQQAADS